MSWEENKELRAAVDALPESDQRRVYDLTAWFRLTAMQHGDIGFISLCLACGEEAEKHEASDTTPLLMKNRE